MPQGLEGRRIALVASEGDAATEIRKELIASGAEVSELPGGASDDRWHSGMYAALVLVGDAGGSGHRDEVRQLVREFLVSEKPVAAFSVNAEELSLDESLVAVRGAGDARAFAREVAAAFGQRLDERAVDEMSEQSFPASDPPAVNPGAAGHLPPDREARG